MYWLLLILALCGAGVSPRVVGAQTSNAQFSGLVRAADDAPIAGATVVLKHEPSGMMRETRTSAVGRYVFPGVNLGGPYTVTVRGVGYAPASRGGLMITIGDRLSVDLRLAPAATQLSSVTVDASTASTRVTRAGASKQIGVAEMQNLPTVNRNFSDLANLAPTTSGLNIGGQRTTSTDIRLDGVQSRNMLTGGDIGRGPYSVSMEALREFEVATNVYDVTQGRQGGGAINVATRSGTNRFEGSLFAYNRNEAFTTRDFTGRAPTDFTNTQWGASIAGPILKDRLHFYAVFDRQDLTEPYFVSDVRTEQDQLAANIAADSLTRALSILQQRYGLSTSSPQVGQFSRDAILNTGMLKADWTIDGRNRLTTRYNYSDWINPGSTTGDQALALLESRGTLFSREHQAMAALQSELRPGVTNDLRLSFNTRRVENQEFSRLPRGFVRVQSRLPDGRNGDVRIQFGGNRISPEWQRDWQAQLLNTVQIERGRSTFSLGMEHTLNFISMYISIEQGGLFEFNSLAELEQLRPFRYTRQVPLLRPEPDVGHYVYDGGLFAQAEFRPTDRLTLAAGLRADVSSFLTRPAANPLAAQQLGIRTDVRLTDANNIQPRAQVTWDVRGTGREVVRLGGGLFVAQPHYYAHINHMLNDGLELGDVFLAGNDVPRPDFLAYRRDLSQVPGVPAGGTTRPAFMNVMGDRYRLPTNYKADVAWQRRLFNDRLQLGVTGQYTKVVDNYHYFDRNLPAQPNFRIASDGNRAVFVPASSIPANGQTNSVNSRANPAFARVLEFRAGAGLTQRAVIIEASTSPWRDAQLGGSVTLNETRDNSSYNCCIARTASFTPIQSDPRDISTAWGFSDNDFRHKVVAYGQLPSFWGVRLSGRFVGQSGSGFHLLVNGDVNGDDHNNNDLAFIPDPNSPTTDPEIAAAMRRLLDNPGNYARDYIRANAGGFGQRNAARSPFARRLDLRLAKSLRIAGRHGAELLVDVFNVERLLNPAWGGRYVVARNQFLLNVIGFDQATQRYRYRVNENVGTTRKSGDPYQIQAGVRYTF
jgi:hypothetical protein